MIQLGSRIRENGCHFTVWAPLREKVSLHIVQPDERIVPMERDESGYWNVFAEGAGDGTLYRYRLDDSVERPDPASCYQPRGVHEASMVIDHRRFSWGNTVNPAIPLEEYIIYEMHVGTFTPQGTFTSAIERLSYLVDLGINAVEIMPVSQFPGAKNWGYDGVYPFAVQNSYGGVDGLKSLVKACHDKNLAVILDVVYNHMGPEGNYLRDFGPYFTDKYRTPWGDSINFDDSCSDPVCDYFISNALYWLDEFRIDALRLDAVHAITDMGAIPFLERLQTAVEKKFEKSPTPKYLMAESDLNDSRIIRSRECGGFAMPCQWSDDFHHALHTLLTGENRGYYQDFGTIDHLYRVYNNAFCYAGHYSKDRKRTHGNDVSYFHTKSFVVCSQNHDQIGNRMLGERLITLTDFERAKLAAAAVLLSPYLPLLFMGEELAEENPFLYFADHTDDSLKQAVREGRRREFAEFHSKGELMDPFADDTYEKSKINWDRLGTEKGLQMFNMYKHLINLRKSTAVGPAPRDGVTVNRYGTSSCLSVTYSKGPESAVCLFNFKDGPEKIICKAERTMIKRFDSRDGNWSREPASLTDRLEEGESEVRLEPYQCAVYVG